MDKRKVHIDEFFARQMDDKAEAPPQKVWDALDKRLDASVGRKKPFPIWWFWAIGGLILLSATGIIASYTADSNQPTNTASSHAVKGEQKPYAQTEAEEPDAENTAQPIDDIAISKVMSTQDVDDRQQINNSQPHNSSTIQEQQTQQPKIKDKLSTAPNGSLQHLANSQPSKTVVEKGTAPLPALPRKKDEVAVLSPKNLAMNKQPSSVQSGYSPSARVPIAKPLLPESAQPTSQLVTKNNTIKQLSSLPLEELIASTQPMPTRNIYQEGVVMNIPAPSDVENGNTHPLQANIKDKMQSTEAIGLIDTSDKDNTDNLVKAEAPKVKKKVSLPIEFGIKAGYSMGFDNTWRANKVAFAPYVSYKLPAGFSLILQPTYHTGNASTGQFDNGNQSYYNVTNNSFDSNSRVVRGVIDSTVVTANPPDTVFRTYTYKQTYDSLHTSYNVSQKRLWDIELPLILKYDINDKFAVFLGASATYSSVLQTEYKEERFSMSNEVVEEIDPETFYVTYQGQRPPEGPAQKGFDEVFSNSGTPLSTYTPRQVSNTKNFMRYGFMIGASYNFNEHWMIDVMMHKTGVDASAVPDKELQKLYEQPYLRIMVGYRLFKSKSMK